MHYRRLGSTGLHVSCLGFGAQNFGGAGHPLYGLLGAIEEPLATRMVGRLLDAGVNLIDTADSYGGGEAETMLGRVLRGRRDEVILCTKAGHRMGPGANDVGHSRVHLTRVVEASLRRLGTDRIDIFTLHGFDRLTRIEDHMRTLDDLIGQGKLRYVACSNFAAWQIMKALGIAAMRGLEPYVAIQAYHSLAGRDIEREIVPLALDQGLALIGWGALAGGFLTGKFGRDTKPDDASRRLRFAFPPVDRDRGYAIIDVARAIAERHGASVAQIALAWQIGRPFMTCTLFGARDEAQLAANLDAIDVELTPQDIAELDAVSALPPEYPQWLFDRPMARDPGEARDWAAARGRME